MHNALASKKKIPDEESKPEQHKQRQSENIV